MAGNAPEASQQPVISGVTAPQLTQIMTVALTAALQSIPGLTQPAQPAQTAPANQVPQPPTQFAPPVQQPRQQAPAQHPQPQQAPAQHNRDAGFSDASGEFTQSQPVREWILDFHNWERLKTPEAFAAAERFFERKLKGARDTTRADSILNALLQHLSLIKRNPDMLYDTSVEEMVTTQLTELVLLDHQAHGRLTQPQAAAAFRARALQRELPSYLNDAMHAAVSAAKIDGAFRSNGGGRASRAKSNANAKRFAGKRKPQKKE